MLTVPTLGQTGTSLKQANHPFKFTSVNSEYKNAASEEEKTAKKKR